MERSASQLAALLFKQQNAPLVWCLWRLLTFGEVATQLRLPSWHSQAMPHSFGMLSFVCTVCSFQIAQRNCVNGRRFTKQSTHALKASRRKPAHSKNPGCQAWLVHSQMTFCECSDELGRKEMHQSKQNCHRWQILSIQSVDKKKCCLEQQILQTQCPCVQTCFVEQ